MQHRTPAIILTFALAACSSDGADPGSPDGGGPGQPGDPVDAADPGDTVDAGDAEEATGCDGTPLLEVPDDPAARGPWPVGARTARVGRLTVEVWYPAAPGSQAGESKTRYDIRQALPASQQDKISDGDNPWQECDCWRDLPVDGDHGPYPVVLFIHGTAGFRTQSLTQMTHWASRGFVVVSADHPGLWLADNLAFVCPDQATGNRDLEGDADAVLAAVSSGSGELGFLADRVDTDRIAVVGHSAGGNAVAGLTDRTGVQVVIPMAASAAASGTELALFLGADADSVVQYSSTQSAYEQTTGNKRLVGIGNSGHLAFSDLCATTNGAGQNLVEIAEENGVCGVQLAGFLFDCDPTRLDDAVGWQIINFASSAVLEEVLHCRPSMDQLSGIQARFADVIEYREAP